jgi:hypothetical protein
MLTTKFLIKNNGEEMSDNKPAAVVKVKYFKKRERQLDKIEFTYQEHLQVRRWFLSGSFTNTYFLKHDFDKSKIHLIKKIITHQPEIIQNLIEETLDKSLNRNTFIYTLVLLSNDNFKAKKIFSSLFNKVIRHPKDLYFFMECCKKERGFGQVIHKAIKDWLKHIDVHQLEKMFVEYRHGYNWKAKDVFSLIRPKPINKQQEILFNWIVTDKYFYNNKREFPLIHVYQSIRENKVLGLIDEDILKKHFNIAMVPSNYSKMKEFIGEWITNFEQPNYPLTNVPKYLDQLNTEKKNYLCSYFKNNDILKKTNLLALLSTYSTLLKDSHNPVDMDILNEVENALEDKIKKTYNNCVHLLDTNNSMLDGTLQYTNTSPAITASVMIGLSKNLMDFTGNVIEKRSSRSILEAEGFVKKELVHLNYRKIFNEMTNMDSEYLLVWTNNKSFDKERFMKEFLKWKMETKRVMKVLFINLYEVKEPKISRYKEVYGINDKTEKFLELIKKGEL